MKRNGTQFKNRTPVRPSVFADAVILLTFASTIVMCSRLLAGENSHSVPAIQSAPRSSVILPTKSAFDWSRTPIDRFISSKLQENRLVPAPEADRRTLLRRLHLINTGLPPTAEQVESFEQDSSPLAWEVAVEQVLHSTEYAEHRAGFWLDAVKYSDTNGYERDEFRPLMWKYRDYVIDSFRADKPFNQFLKEQLIGDRLVSRPFQQSDRDRVVATGFYRLGTRDSTLDIFGENARGRDAWMTDIVETVGTVMTGLTLDCARCHDHKSEAISQRDYMSIRNAFANLKPDDESTIDLEQKRIAIASSNATTQTELDIVNTAITELTRDPELRLRNSKLAELPANIRQLMQQPMQALNQGERDLRNQYASLVDVSTREVLDVLGPADRSKANALLEQKSMIEQRLLQPEFASGVTGRRSSRGQSFDVERSSNDNLFQHGRVVHHTGPLQGLPLTPSRQDLANWVASSNRQVARTVINNIWRRHFGQGLISTSENTGPSSDAASHPELLEWLADELIRSDWSIRHIDRLILTSAVWMQSSEGSAAGRRIDPDNHLLWRQNRQRLRAESLRDSVLQIVGTLDTSRYGAPRWPKMSEEWLSTSIGILETRRGNNEGRLQDWYTTPEQTNSVRSIYLVHKRSLPLPFLTKWGSPDRDRCSLHRDDTIDSAQALEQWAGQFINHSAQQWATTLIARSSDEDEIIRHMWSDAVQRKPTMSEIALARAFLKRTPGETGTPSNQQRADRVTRLCRIVLNTNEVLYVD